MIALSTQLSPPPWLQTAALFAHLIALAVGFGAVLAVDWYGLLFLRGLLSMGDVLTVAHRLSPLIWLGLMGLTVTGALLEPDLGSALTLVKMACVVGTAVVGVLAQATKRQMVRRLPVLPRGLLLRGMVIAAASQALWWAAVLIGFVTHLQRQT